MGCGGVLGGDRDRAGFVRVIAVDLFSGTGGATAAFRLRPAWRVVALELEPRRRSPLGPEVRADVRRLPLRGSVDFLWASPPCTEFSQADARVEQATKHPNTSLVAATLAAVAELRPRFWILENVRGAIPFLGIPVQKVGPWCLWGYFPKIEVTPSLARHRKSGKPSAEARAAVPFELSEAVARSVEKHLELDRILDLRTIRVHRHLRRRRAPEPSLFGGRW